MQKNITLKKIAGLVKLTFAIVFLTVFASSTTTAQTVVSTASGVNYLNDYSINNPAALVQSFAVQNNNATDVVLTQVDMQMQPVFSPAGTASPVNLYYSATSLSGPFTAPGAGWTLIGSGSLTIPAGLSFVTAISGINFVIPANTQYRFAIEAIGLSFSFSPTPSPNNFTNGGVSLQVGDFQIAGANVGYAGVSPTPNVGNTPSFFGGSITVFPSSACSGSPTPGATLSTVPTVCPGTNFTLSTSTPPAPGTSGITYQWQSSADGVTWTNITGATNSTLTTTLAASTYYQNLVTCSGNTVSSTPIQVLLTPASGCYCTPPSTNCNLDDVILNVTGGGIDNTTTCSPNGYGNYTNSVPAGSAAAGLSMPLSVEVGPGGTEYVSVWIDYNKNGVFEANEFTALGSANGGVVSGTVNIAGNATPGLTRMRVRVRFNTPNTGADACSGYTYGETEDYAFNITPCLVGAITAQPTNKSTTCSGVTTFAVTATGTGLTYQWQERINATAPWTIISNGGIYAGASTATLTLSNLTTASNGHQFQVAIGGPCTPLFLSSVATLTVGPLVALVAPSSATLCTGQIQQFNVTNTSLPATSAYQSSGPINVTIPDDNVYGNGDNNGVNNTINVTTIPAGAVLTGLSVRLNIVHSWAGDLVVVLKAPNGKIYNLDYALTATGGSGPTAGFTNTIISSIGTAALSSGTSPFTATFKADNQDPALGDPDVPLGPAGFIPNTRDLTELYSVTNGGWTLALYDYFDDYTTTNKFVDWAISFTYGAPQTGIFTPSTGLFTDAAATIPYTGTPISTVYAQPSVSTDYSLVVTNATCVSAPTIIPVTVVTALGTVTNPTDMAVCLNSNTSFTASATGGPATYQWQVSTDGGATWNNVSNGGVYSGATTSTLTLTNVPAIIGYDNNQYRAVLSVSACANSANSAAATLTVNALPNVVIAAGPYTALYPGITTTITAAVSPTAAASYQWYKNGVAVPGATAATIVVDVDNVGDYTVTVNDVNGCSNTSAALTISSAAKDILFIYPSPNTGQFQVRYFNTIGNTANPRTLTIYDSKGARVYSRVYDINLPYSKMDVDMSQYSKGIYHVELGDRSGKRIKTGSVIIL